MYKFRPILKTLVWGTESWVLSGAPGNVSIVAEGPDEGKTLTDVYGREFPLLIKFIDARQDLSIQVHPDDELAARRHGGRGKTEMWYVTGASADAHLLCGFNSRIDPVIYDRLVKEDAIVSVLSDHKVSPGDAFYIPAGSIHAICGGCRLAEIQQASDITYRIYDYNRPGLDGRPRPLHADEARDAIDYTALKDCRAAYRKCRNRRCTLVDSPYFKTSLYELDRPVEVKVPGDFLAVVCTRGRGKAGGYGISEGEALLALGEKSFLVEPEGDMTLLTSYV